MNTFRHLIFPPQDRTGQRVLARDVRPSEVDYLRSVVIPRLRPLSEDEYVNGPHAIVATMARWSYILSSHYLYWCIEWDPGLLVICFSPDGQMQWCALRSPDPQFGGRRASPAEIDAFDEDQPNPQYHLVFEALDSQFEPREDKGWKLASAVEVRAWRAAIFRANVIGHKVEALTEQQRSEWLARCRISPIWRGTIEH